MYRECFQHLYEVVRHRIPPTPMVDMRLHRLERPEPWSAELISLMTSEAKFSTIQQYPDYAPFKERLANFFAVRLMHLVMGAGVEDHVRSLIMLACDPGDAVLMPYPSCAMFELHAKNFGATVTRFIWPPDRMRENAEFTQWLLEDIENVPRLKLVLLVNPGQPVETCLGVDALARVADACRKRNIVLVVDEAYHWFGAASALALVPEFNNVVVLRSFSKAFGAASLRLGVAIGSTSVVKPLDAIRLSGEVTGPTMRMVTVLLDHWSSHVQPAIEEIRQARAWLRDRISELGYPAYGWYANHVLVDMKSTAAMKDVLSRLEKNGVHVKGGFAPPIDRHILITCGSGGLMAEFYDEFLAAIRLDVIGR